MLENISKLADDIVLTEDEKKKIFASYHRRMEVQKRKKAVIKKFYQAAAVASVFVAIAVFSATSLPSSHLAVYAAAKDRRVQLKINEKEYLEKVITPWGYGYLLELQVEEGACYYTIEGTDNLNADNIFRNGSKIYWIPDGVYTENFRDQDGKIIQIPETDNSTLHIRVCDSEGKEIEKIMLILERRDGKCSAEMLIK